MSQLLQRGALARAAIAVLCLVLAQASVSGSAKAADSYRADLDPFATWQPQPVGASRAVRPTFAHGKVAAMVVAEAEALDVPVRLAVAVARFESGLRMSMRGAAGERGAMQVLPQTARQVGVAGDLYGRAGIEAGVRYLKLAMAMHGNAGWCAVASAYNRGVWRRSRCTAYGRAVAAMAALR